MVQDQQRQSSEKKQNSFKFLSPNKDNIKS